MDTLTSRTDANTEIHIMNADGTGQIESTDIMAADTAPAWSPE